MELCNWFIINFPIASRGLLHKLVARWLKAALRLVLLITATELSSEDIGTFIMNLSFINIYLF